jgi:4-alpha-glucanotransferase
MSHMNTNFHIQYKTNWGESLFVCGNDQALGNWNPDKAIPMQYIGNSFWQAEVELGPSQSYQYKYFLRNHDGQLIWEGGENRAFETNGKYGLFLYDKWQAYVDPDRVLLSKVFTEVIFKPLKILTIRRPARASRILRLRIEAPRVGPGFGLAITGSAKALGNWKKPVFLSNLNYPFWQLELDVDKLEYPLNYKYVIVRLKDGEITSWETGPNRLITAPPTESPKSLSIIQEDSFRYPVGNWKGAGVAVPVFSLRTYDSFGVGEFNDLKKLVDWCVATGLKMIQLLPINETVATHSWLDSYPYKSITVRALHPMYLNLDSLGKLNNKKEQNAFNRLKIKLNKLTHVDYVEVTKAKSRYFKLIFDQTWNEVKETASYKDFYNENKDWLVPYAAFCYLRDQFKTSNFRKWKGWDTYEPAKIAELTDPTQEFHEHIAVHYFIQYHLDKQLQEAVDYAHSKGVGIKGDIPIGISPDSIEAWTEPELFNLKGQAGAPPDDFAVMGQNWGFPTYNWEEMARDGYRWWRTRLLMMEKYFDAYRIDHILGFFRIWEIPFDNLHGLLGYFKPSLPMTVSEIEDWGLWFDAERYTKPYIRGHFLHDFFGEYTDEVRRKYLTETEMDVYQLKAEVSTQRKIYNLFTPEGQLKDSKAKDVIIRDGLMSLLDEVLFIKDPYAPHRAYHPRIAFHYTFAYHDLDDETKGILNELYIHYFYKRHDEFWKHEAMTKLPTIVNASNMLVCGEDLGMVPESVPEVMAALNILSLEIQRMPKNPRVTFGHPSDAPYLSVCTTSTHDMPTIRGWWEEDREKSQRFYKHILGHNDQAPFFAEPWVCRQIIEQHLHSPAMWTIFPIQDLIAMDGNLRWDQTDKEQINKPSDPENKWQYRMILSLEELIRATEFNKMLKGLVHLSGRDADY